MSDDEFYKDDDMLNRSDARGHNMRDRLSRARRTDDGTMGRMDNVLLQSINLLMKARDDHVTKLADQDAVPDRVLEEEWRVALVALEKYMDGLQRSSVAVDKPAITLQSDTTVHVDDRVNKTIGHVACTTDPMSADMLHRVMSILVGDVDNARSKEEFLPLMAPMGLFVDAGSLLTSNADMEGMDETERRRVMDAAMMVTGPFVRLDEGCLDSDAMHSAIILARFVSLWIYEENYGALPVGSDRLSNVVSVCVEGMNEVAGTVDENNLGKFVEYDSSTGMMTLFGSSLLFRQWMMVLAKAASMLAMREPVWKVVLTDAMIFRCIDDDYSVTPDNVAIKLQWATTDELDMTVEEPNVVFFPTMVMLMYERFVGVDSEKPVEEVVTTFSEDGRDREIKTLRLEDVIARMMETRGWSNRASVRNAISLFEILVGDDLNESCCELYTKLTQSFFSHTFVPMSIADLFAGGGGLNAVLLDNEDTVRDKARKVLLGILSATMPRDAVFTNDRVAVACVEFVMDIANMIFTDGVDSRELEVCAYCLDSPLVVVDKVKMLWVDSLLNDVECRHCMTGCVMFVLDNMDSLMERKREVGVSEDRPDMLHFLLWLLWCGVGVLCSPYDADDKDRSGLIDEYLQDRDRFVGMLCVMLGLDMRELDGEDDMMTVLMMDDFLMEKTMLMYPPVFNDGVDHNVVEEIVIGTDFLTVTKKAREDGMVSLHDVLTAVRELLAMIALYDVTNCDMQLAPLSALTTMLHEMDIKGLRTCMSILDMDRPMDALLKDYGRPRTIANTLASAQPRDGHDGSGSRNRNRNKEDDKLWLDRMSDMAQQISAWANTSSAVSSILDIICTMSSTYHLSLVAYTKDDTPTDGSSVPVDRMLHVLGRRTKESPMDVVTGDEFVDGMREALNALSIFSSIACMTHTHAHNGDTHTDTTAINNVIDMMHDTQRSVIDDIQQVTRSGDEHAIAAYLSGSLRVHRDSPHTCSLVEHWLPIETLTFNQCVVPLPLVIPLSAYNDVPLTDEYTPTAEHTSLFVRSLSILMPELKDDIELQYSHLLTQSVLDLMYVMHSTGKAVSTSYTINKLGFVDTLHFLVVASNINRYNIEHVAGEYFMNTVDYPAQHDWFEHVGLLDPEGEFGDVEDNNDRPIACHPDYHYEEGCEEDGEEDDIYMESPNASPIPIPLSPQPQHSQHYNFITDTEYDSTLDEPPVSNVNVLAGLLSSTTSSRRTEMMNRTIIQRAHADDTEVKMSQTRDDAMPRTTRLRDSDVRGIDRMTTTKNMTMTKTMTKGNTLDNGVISTDDDDDDDDDSKNDSDSDSDVMVNDEDEIYDGDELMEKCGINRFGKLGK